MKENNKKYDAIIIGGGHNAAMVLLSKNEK
jgi:phytoene dehydrogenase-like protein